jgi:hypothetical protein
MARSNCSLPSGWIGFVARRSADRRIALTARALAVRGVRRDAVIA